MYPPCITTFKMLGKNIYEVNLGHVKYIYLQQVKQVVKPSWYKMQEKSSRFSHFYSLYIEENGEETIPHLMFSPVSGQLVSDDRSLSESLDIEIEVTDLNCCVRCNTVL